MKKKRIFIILGLFLLLVITIISLYFIIFPHIEFKLIGNSEIILNYKDEYQEEGVIAKINGLIDYSKNVIIDNSKLNLNKIGTYTINYH